MREFLMILYFLAGLAGCNVLPNHGISIRSEIDGVVVLDSRTTRVPNGAEKFSCRASGSGQCHYLLYVEHCSGAAVDDATPGNGAGRRERCAPQTLHVFSVAAGQSTVISGIDPAFRQCVAIDRTPVAPTCSEP